MNQIIEQMLKQYTTNTIHEKKNGIKEVVHMRRNTDFSPSRMKSRCMDYAQAKQDVIPFIKNPSALDVWSADFFCQITDHLDI